MIPLAGRTVIVVDDGIATGGTARAALEVARAHGREPRRARGARSRRPRPSPRWPPIADEVVVLETPTPFFAIGEWYEDFSQTPDDEVVGLLRAAAPAAALSAEADPPGDDPGVSSTRRRDRDHGTRRRRWPAISPFPPHAVGVVLFAHGSGSSRHSPRNQFVARHSTPQASPRCSSICSRPHEALDRANVFDIELLADRLRAVAHWLHRQPTARTSASATSVPAPAPPPRCGQPPMTRPVRGRRLARRPT